MRRNGIGQITAKKASGGLRLLLCFLTVSMVLLLLFLPEILDKNAAWRKNEKITSYAQNASSAFAGHPIEEGLILDAPYMVICLDGTSYAVNLRDAKLWKKPFFHLHDGNIDEIKTFVFVVNRKADRVRYTDGSVATSYDAFIQYINNDGAYLGQDFIAAPPLPDKKAFGSGGQIDYGASKSQVMRVVKTRFT